MSRLPYHPADHPLRRAELPARRALPWAALWALVRAFDIALVFALVSLGLHGLILLAESDHSGLPGPARSLVEWLQLGPGFLTSQVVFELVARAGWVLLIAFVPLWIGRLFRSWATLTDSTFQAMAFRFTFFGLGMLAVFFAGLVEDAVTWFEVMPPMIETRNQELAEKAAQGRELQALLDKRKREVDDDMARYLEIAKTEEGRKTLEAVEVIKPGATEAEAQAQVRKYFEEVKANAVANEEQKAADWIRGEQQIRPDTSPGALLVHFFIEGPSDIPQDAGILPALLGSVFLVLITLLAAVPLGVGAAVYLEEYRHTGWLARVIQVNINNLAGVPSVVYGILGAFVFVELIFKPIHLAHPTIDARNVLGGGLTLALLTLPLVIVASQEAIRAVPVSIRHGALALGATRWQVIWHHVLPNARGGILTGTILAISRAIGEAAPLILFGALLFVNHNPSLFSRFTVLPMQIFGWADRPAEVWKYNAAMASIVLVGTLLTLNGVAIYLRQRVQRHGKL